MLSVVFFLKSDSSAFLLEVFSVFFAWFSSGSSVMFGIFVQQILVFFRWAATFHSV